MKFFGKIAHKQRLRKARECIEIVPASSVKYEQVEITESYQYTRVEMSKTYGKAGFRK